MRWKMADGGLVFPNRRPQISVEEKEKVKKPTPKGKNKKTKTRNEDLPPAVNSGFNPRP